MTIADTSRRAGPYTISTGASYPFSFVVFGTDQITVTVADDDGKETVLTSSQYTVTLNDNGGTVVLADSVEGATLVITSNVPITQETVITNKGGFYPDVLNDSYDKLTAICQQLEEKIERSIKVDVTGTISASEFKAELESIATEAKTIATDAQTVAGEAQTKATSAEALASQANTTANSADETASTALATANSANTTAGNAVSTAESASTSATEALSIATNAQTRANTAVSTANTAVTKADAASTNANTAVSTVNQIQSELPSDIEAEVSKQIGEELEATVAGIVREVAPEIIEETAASKDYVDSAVNTLDGELATVAKTGSYNDLSEKPSNVSAFTNDAGYLTFDSELDISKLSNQSGNANKFLTTDGTSASWASVPTRGIGEIVQSAVPLTDAGLHLMDGSLLASGGVYDAFISYMNGLQPSYPDLFCTETEWQTSVSTYGSCGKFVYSSSGVRLPKVSDILQGTTDTSAVGDLIEAGLPNITGEFEAGVNGVGGVFSGGSGAFYKRSPSNDNYSAKTGDLANDKWWVEGFDASRSSSIYGNSTTVQQQAIKVLFYICVATTTKTGIEVDIDNVVTELNGKLDTAGGTMTGTLTGAGATFTSLSVGGYTSETVVESGSNYIRYASGVQICWGSLTATGSIDAKSSVSRTTSFPKTFKNTSTVITVCCKTDGGFTNYLRQNSYAIGTSSVTVSFFNSNTTTCGSTTYTYTAIGYWK